MLRRSALIDWLMDEVTSLRVIWHRALRSEIFTCMKVQTVLW